jgi:branched-chain amino acid transport system substrate-binding protein
VLLGSIYPLSGTLATESGMFNNGIDLAVEQINSAGGVACLNGAKLRVEHADSQGQPAVGAREAQRLIDAGAVALFGALQSSVTMSTTEVAEQARVPYMVVGAPDDAILKQGLTYSFRVQPNQTQMVDSFLQHLLGLLTAQTEPISTAVVLHEDSPFGTGFADVLKKRAPAQNIHILDDISYTAAGLTDIAPLLDRARALNPDPDIVIVIGRYTDSVLIAQTAASMKFAPPLMGLDDGAWSTPQFITGLGDTASWYFNEMYTANPRNEKSQQVRDAYRARFSAEMPPQAIMAYQSVFVLHDALSRACSLDHGKLREALAQTNYADHILAYTGPITFDGSGQAADARSLMLQVQNGAVAVVKPEDLADAPIMFPPPQTGP